MRIGILGTGPMTAVLGAGWSRAGHEVVIGSRDPARARRLSERHGAAGGMAYQEAARSDVVVIAVHDTEVLPIVASLRDILAGVIVIDINNPIDPPAYESRYAGGASLGERLADAAPGARVVKAFNTVYAERLAEGTHEPSGPVQVLLASDDQTAKETVAVLVGQLDAEPVDVGPLRVSRHLEALAGFEVDLVERGFAPVVGFRLVVSPGESPRRPST
ncbi:NADPH-dependent F420 reductase [Leifsonia sp. LS-T14]|uniref:NADPH-dependent F420 reductase n=1 Tax=unclassified Leifsonia TaxID=2663824 RepID=UPI0035A6D41E